MSKKKGKKEQKKSRRISFFYILGGGILKEEYITKHTPMFLLIMVLTFVFIANRYSCQKKIREIDLKQQTLKDLRYESLSISSELMEETSSARIEQLVKSKGLDLEIPVTPPFYLQK